jgi:hypothetical protein
MGEPHRYLVLRLLVADVRPRKQQLRCVANQLNQRLILFKLRPLYNRGRAVPPDRARPRSQPIPQTPRGRGHYSPSILSEVLRSGYALRASGGIIRSAMTRPPCHVVVRAGARLIATCAGPPSLSDSIKNKVAETIADPAQGLVRN